MFKEKRETVIGSVEESSSNDVIVEDFVSRDDRKRSLILPQIYASLSLRKIKGYTTGAGIGYIPSHGYFLSFVELESHLLQIAQRTRAVTCSGIDGVWWGGLQLLDRWKKSVIPLTRSVFPGNPLCQIARIKEWRVHPHS